MVIISFFIAHWMLSVFCQTFFLHRYGSHRMFHLSKGWERFFHLLTYLSQGASYLNPRGYALLHRLHHAHSDTVKDPHTPTLYGNVLTMMLATKKRYQAIKTSPEKPSDKAEGSYPVWPLLDRIGDHPLSIVFWVCFYTGFYWYFATEWWQWAFLLPMQIIMGPIHGALVNWCGHKYGYRNFGVDDKSMNTLPFDFLAFGELFQNNHHRFGKDPNFAKRWFEIDPCYQVIRALRAFGIVRTSPQA